MSHGHHLFGELHCLSPAYNFISPISDKDAYGALSGHWNIISLTT